LALADGYKNVLIPIDQYAGSKERSKSEQGKTHLLSPLLKKLDKIKLSAMNQARAKKGNVSAKQKAMATKFKFQEDITESPDDVMGNAFYLRFHHSDARAFGWQRNGDHEGDALVGEENGKTHGSIIDHDGHRVGSRSNLHYAGRLWTSQKIISFWDYPKASDLPKMIKQLNKELKQYNEKIDINTWGVDVVADSKGKWAKKIKGDVNFKNDRWNIWDTTTVIIPLKKFAGSEKRTAEEMGKSHLLSPLLKKISAAKKEKLKAMDSARSKKGHTSAKQKAMMTKFKFSEDITESPDKVAISDNGTVTHRDNEAYSFAPGGNDLKTMFISDKGSSHSSMIVQYPGVGFNWEYSGRVWIKHKIIAFWYVPNKNKLKTQLKYINKALKEVTGVQINDDWLIELKGDYFKKNPDRLELAPYFEEHGYGLLPIKYYTGQPPKHDSKAYQQHQASPMKKKVNKAKLSAMGNARMKKGGTTAKQKAMATKFKFSEDKLNEGRVFKSAGIVPYIKKGGEIYYLLLHSGRLWGFPKGMLDKGEDSVATAKRETKEETGISISKIDSGWKAAQKFFVNVDYSTGEKLDKPAPKFVVYFLGESPTEKVKLSFEHTKYKWVKYEEGLKLLKFGKDILKKANEHLIKNEIRESVKLNDEIIGRFIEETDIVAIIKEASINSRAPTDDGPPIFYKTFAEYKRVSKKWLNSMFQETGWEVMDYILSHGAEDPENDFTMEYSTVPAVAYGKTGDGEGYPDPVGRYKKHFAKMNRELGWEIIKWMGIDGKKVTGVGAKAPVAAGAKDGTENSDRMEKDKEMNENLFTQEW